MTQPKADEKWEIESDARTLISAQEILNDKKKLPKVKIELARQAKAAAEAVKEAELHAKVADGLAKAFSKKEK